MPRSVRVVSYGLGSIGTRIASLALSKRGIRVVGAVDIDESKAGRDLGAILGLTKPLGVKVQRRLQTVRGLMLGDVILHATSSLLKHVAGEILEAVEKGLHVVSTCEELAFPLPEHSKLSSSIDSAAKRRGVVVLATGVNPGFAMDALPIMFTGVCEHVSRVQVERVVDASQRRLPLQRKIGAGISREEFDQRVAKGSIGHVGLKQSTAMISAAVGWRLDVIDERIHPKLADERTATEFLVVDEGQVAGIDQSCRGFVRGEEVISLRLQMYVGAAEPHDSIVIEGRPNIRVIIPGGVPGDIATAALVVNSIPRVLTSSPGLRTVKDLPMASAIMADVQRLLP